MPDVNVIVDYQDALTAAYAVEDQINHFRALRRFEIERGRLDQSAFWYERICLRKELVRRLRNARDVEPCS